MKSKRRSSLTDLDRPESVPSEGERDGCSRRSARRRPAQLTRPFRRHRPARPSAAPAAPADRIGQPATRSPRRDVCGPARCIRSPAPSELAPVSLAPNARNRTPRRLRSHRAPARTPTTRAGPARPACGRTRPAPLPDPDHSRAAGRRSPALTQFDEAIKLRNRCAHDRSRPAPAFARTRPAAGTSSQPSP